MSQKKKKSIKYPKTFMYKVSMMVRSGNATVIGIVKALKIAQKMMKRSHRSFQTEPHLQRQ